MSVAELLHLQQGLISEQANFAALPEEYFLMDHPDYLEDGFYPDDYFVWPVGHSDYADLTKNDKDAKEIGNPADQEDEDEDDFDIDDPAAKELDVVDPINHPVHWIPDRPSNPGYDSIDPRHHSDFYPDDGPDDTKLHLTRNLDDRKKVKGGPVKDNMHSRYIPTHASERHPLPVEYEYHHQVRHHLHPIHPSLQPHS